MNKAQLDAYCKAWEQSFKADNPFHTVTMNPEDEKHIAAGLAAATFAAVVIIALVAIVLRSMMLAIVEFYQGY